MVTRSQWRAKPPTRGGNKISPKPKGTAVHWEGPKMGSFSHDKCAAKVRGIQAFHMNTRGWADIAYNYVVCPHGYVFEGRGLNIGSGANGTTQANYDYYAVCALTGEGDPTTAALLVGINDAVLLCQTRAAKTVIGHRDCIQTTCPGPELYAAVKAGKFGKAGAPASPPASAIPSLPKPAPGRLLTEDGKADAGTIKVFQKFLAVPADGIWGPNTSKALQRWVRLDADGIIGKQTAKALQKKVSAKQTGGFSLSATKSDPTVLAWEKYINRGIKAGTWSA